MQNHLEITSKSGLDPKCAKFDQKSEFGHVRTCQGQSKRTSPCQQLFSSMGPMPLIVQGPTASSSENCRGSRGATLASTLSEIKKRQNSPASTAISSQQMQGWESEIALHDVPIADKGSTTGANREGHKGTTGRICFDAFQSNS